jgi:hypothetical protein
MPLYELEDVICVSVNGNQIVKEDDRVYAVDAQVAFECFKIFHHRRNPQNVPIQILKPYENSNEEIDTVYRVVRTRQIFLFSNYIGTMLRLERTLIFDAATLNNIVRCLRSSIIPEPSFIIQEAEDITDQIAEQ